MTSAAVLAAWGAVRVFGNERQRRIEEIQAEAAAADAALLAASNPDANPPEATLTH